MIDPPSHPGYRGDHRAPDQFMPTPFLSWGYPSSDNRLVVYDIGRTAMAKELVDPGGHTAYEVGLVLFDQLLALLDRWQHRGAIAVPPALVLALGVFADRHPANWWLCSQQRIGALLGLTGRYRFASVDEYAASFAGVGGADDLISAIWPAPGTANAWQSLWLPKSPAWVPPCESFPYRMGPGSPELARQFDRWANLLAPRIGVTTNVARRHLGAAIDAISVWERTDRGLGITRRLAETWSFLQTKHRFYGPWCERYLTVAAPVQYSSLEFVRQERYEETQELFLAHNVDLDPLVWVDTDDPSFELAPFVPPLDRAALFRALFGEQNTDHSSLRRRTSQAQVITLPVATDGLRSLPVLSPKDLASFASKWNGANNVTVIGVRADEKHLHEQLGFPTDAAPQTRQLCHTTRGLSMKWATANDATAFALNDDEYSTTLLVARADARAGEELAASLRHFVEHLPSVAVAEADLSAHNIHTTAAVTHRARVVAYARRVLQRFDAALRIADEELEKCGGLDDHALASNKVAHAQRHVTEAIRVIGAASTLYSPRALLAATDVEHFGPLRAFGHHPCVTTFSPLGGTVLHGEGVELLESIGEFVAALHLPGRRSSALDLADLGSSLRRDHGIARYLPPDVTLDITDFWAASQQQ